MAERSVKAWSIDVPVTADIAFAYLADVTRHAEWSPKPYWIDPPPELPLAAGSTFRSHGHIPGEKDHVNEVEVVEFDPPHTLALVSAERGDRYVHRFDVVGTASGCEITRTVDSPKPAGVLGFLFPVLFALLIKPEVSRGMEMLRSNLSQPQGGFQP
ncbi:MAG TPA: SRPBCC family protein [Acidimicrobiia bacterium]|nr:SRPBCC family protein [Acidimicrobiia bacterium]